MESKLYKGEVIFFSAKKGYGFISWSDGSTPQKDMFVHFTDIVCDGFKTLNKGQKVEFTLGENRNSDPKAMNVKVIQ